MRQNRLILLHRRDDGMSIALRLSSMRPVEVIVALFFSLP